MYLIIIIPSASERNIPIPYVGIQFTFLTNTLK